MNADLAYFIERDVGKGERWLGLFYRDDRLSMMHGVGGSEVKMQQIPQGAMIVLKTSVAVGSANLEEAQPKE